MSRRRRIPEVLTPEEQEALLAQPDRRKPVGERNWLIMRLMLDAGLRLSEVINLRWNDVDLATGMLHVKLGKGGKDRILWLNEGVLVALKRWKERQRELLGREADHVFTTLGRRGSKGKPLCPRYIQQMVTRYAENAGIKKRVHPHTLRHTFATDLLRATKNIRLVQRALGHADLSTTQVYTHIVDEELENALKNLRKSS